MSNLSKFGQRMYALRNTRTKIRRSVYARLPRWLRTHDFEILAAILALFGGLPLLFGQVRPESAESLLPPLIVVVWGSALSGGGFLVLVGVIKGSFTVFPQRAFWMRIESLGLTSLAYFSYIYAVCLFGAALEAGWVALVITVAFGGICHTRHLAVQLKLEDYRAGLGLDERA